MRTTINLNDRLLREAKRRAATEGKTLGQVMEQALRAYLAGPRARSSFTLQWRTERGRIQPGVRLDDRDALFDLLEGRE